MNLFIVIRYLIEVRLRPVELIGVVVAVAARRTDLLVDGLVGVLLFLLCLFVADILVVSDVARAIG